MRVLWESREEIYSYILLQLPLSLARVLPRRWWLPKKEAPESTFSRITTVQDDTSDDLFPGPQPPAFCLPLQELDVLVGRITKVPAIFDTGSQIVVIRQDIVESLGIRVNTQRLIEMEGENGATNWTVGCAENLTLQVGDVQSKIHAHVVEHASFGLLLGRPFQRSSSLPIRGSPQWRGRDFRVRPASV